MKYKFDIDLGHYIALNEDDNNVTVQTNDNTEQQNNSVQGIPSLNTPDVTTLQQKMETTLKTFDTDIQNLKDQEVQLETILSTAVSQFNNATPEQKQNIRKSIVDTNNKILDVKTKISNKQKDKAVTQNQFELQILQLQQKVNENLLPTTKLPEKYKSLNESNIQNAKIYLNNLVGNEDIYIIKGMADFKRALYKSELLYGKDKEGYFVICIDNEDFNKLYKAMGLVGYTRDRIIDAILPQVLDRGNMVQ